jgi:O-antigen biosynthesis protein
MTARIISNKNFEISFRTEFANLFQQANPEKVALLVTCEYEGIFKNGGVGTYYRTLSDRLADDNWYVILLLFFADERFHGSSTFPALKHIFSTTEVAEVLNLQPIHLELLEEAESDIFDLESFRACLFTQAIAASFKQAKVYVEFPEMMGIGYRTIQAKQAGLLHANCVTAVTMHSGHEWVFEANEKFEEDTPERLWHVCHYEQSSFENADLIFFPSHFLKHKVGSYGWETSQAKHMPYFVPLVSTDQSPNGEQLDIEHEANDQSN